VIEAKSIEEEIAV